MYVQKQAVRITGSGCVNSEGVKLKVVFTFVIINFFMSFIIALHKLLFTVNKDHSKHDSLTTQPMWVHQTDSLCFSSFLSVRWV